MSNSDPQYYFVHLPKCAGTSVLKSLGRIGSRRFLILSESPDSKNRALKDLQSAIGARKQTIEDIDLIMGHDVFHGLHSISKRPAHYFTILRDPVARYISQYRYLIDCATNRRSPIHEFAREKMSDDGRLLSLEESVERMYWHNLVTNYLAAANHPDWRTKRWQIEDPDEQFELARDFIDQMSFIGFVESIEADTAILCAKFGLRHQLKVVNRSKSRLDFDLPESTIAGIRKLNELDQQVYDHAQSLRSKMS